MNELCNLKIEDIDFEHGCVHFEIAKGGQLKTLVTPTHTLEALQVHLHDRETGYVFLGRQDGHLSTRQVQRILDELAT